ncbi:MAG: biotin--[acetyl-CoA-carboxylase] ligase [Terriglobales bacterium]
MPPARFGHPRFEFASLPSTQQAWLEAASAGASAGTLFLARAQTQGRGRHGHAWASAPDAGIYASLVLRPLRPAAALLTLTLAAGLGLADAVAQATGLEPALRWPNDLLLGGRKFCGILIESGGDASRSHAVLGFGINLRREAVTPEIAAVATAVELHTLRPHAPEAVLEAALRHLEARYQRWSAAEDAALLQEFEARCPLVRGAEVVVAGASPTPYRARTDGLDPCGFLRLRFPDGSCGVVVNGDVRPA